MIVFKLYFKILKKNFGLIMIYLGVFIGLIFIMMNAYTNQPANFSVVKTKAAIFDYDNTEFTEGFIEFLTNFANFVQLKEDKVDDAFFYREIETLIEIPEGFTASFATPNAKQLLYRTVPASANSFSLERAINKYLNFAEIYVKHDLSTSDLNQTLKEILAKEAQVEMRKESPLEYGFVNFYYNYCSYIYMAMFITVFGIIMLSFKPIGIKRRNELGMISNQRMSLYMSLANFIFGFALVFAIVLFSVVLYPSVMLTPKGFLLMGNSFLHAFTIIALAYLISTLFNSPNVVAAMGTIFALGGSFITGVFIPQMFLDKNLLLFSRLLPSFWYVQANDIIANLMKFDYNSLAPILKNFLVQIIFLVIFISVTIIVGRKRRMSEN